MIYFADVLISIGWALIIARHVAAIFFSRVCIIVAFGT